MKIRFILNPKSGNSVCEPEPLARCIQLNFPGADMRLTQGPNHATELATEAVSLGFDVVVAIGGDGTINETARGLVGTKTALGVIPHGSGNGFAREIGMPLLFEEAVVRLQKGHIVPCDIGRANGELFLNLAGVGIEAEIAWQFMQHGKMGKRGKWPYFKLGTQTVFSYEPEVLTLETDEKTEKISPLTLVFANGRQYGSNFKIAPQASLTDGKLDMVTVQNVAKWKLIMAMPSFFTDNWRPFGVTQTSHVKKAVITKSGRLVYHLDGEPRQTTDRLEITLEEKALLVLFPEK
jgi:YegS/Rv2252/BmrU family lipid kinase